MMIGDPLPAGARLYAMAAEMGRPVARGQLPLEQARAACIAATVAAERAGETGRYAASDIVRMQRHLLDQAIEREMRRRALVRSAIFRVVWPMIRRWQPSNAILAEAHSVNGAHGFPFLEEEVAELVADAVRASLPKPVRRGAGRRRRG